jgi:hypothetical protein
MYLIYASQTDDEAAWLAQINAGEVQADFTVPASDASWRFPDGIDFNNYDFAVVSHATNPDTGEERWSDAYSPEAWHDVPLAEAGPDLAGVSGGALLYAA